MQGLMITQLIPPLLQRILTPTVEHLMPHLRIRRLHQRHKLISDTSPSTSFDDVCHHKRSERMAEKSGFDKLSSILFYLRTRNLEFEKVKFQKRSATRFSLYGIVTSLSTQRSTRPWPSRESDKEMK